MNSTVALIINIPTLFLLFILMYFTQALSGKRQFYGVSLNSDYFDKSEFKALDKRFKLLLTIGFVVFSIITLICIYVFKAYDASSILPILGFCLYQFLVFVHIHNNVKILKCNLALTNGDLEIEKTKVVFDTDFINEKNRIINKFSILFIAPLLVVVLVGVYGLTQYSSMPDIIPIHWGPSGAADNFTDKTFISVLSQIFMMISMAILISVTCIYSLKSRIKMSTTNVDEGKNINLYFLNRFGFAFLLMNLACQVMFIAILLAVINATDVNSFIMFSCTALIIISSIYLTYLYYKSPSKSKSASYSVDDEDSLWILGSIYNNPNDPSIFVQKRFGVGWTVNIGTTKGKVFFILPFIIILVTLMFI